jgi:hypothetical protein
VGAFVFLRQPKNRQDSRACGDHARDHPSFVDVDVVDFDCYVHSHDEA